jgi:hypothetical protein
VRILCENCSNSDELFVFELLIEHDSNAWICKLQAITLWEKAGDEVLWGGTGKGEGGVACLGMDWGIFASVSL